MLAYKLEISEKAIRDIRKIRNYSEKYNVNKAIKKIYNDIITTGKLGSMLNNTYGNFL